MHSKQIVSVCAAVAGILGTLPAQALDVNSTLNAQIELNITGASAARDSFLAFVRDTLCNADFNAYRTDDASISTSNLDPDFRVYSCTLKSGSPDLTDSIEGKTAAIYYRSEGGSVYGPGPIVKGVSVKRLRLTSACTTAASTAFGTCAISGYVLATDAATDSTHIVNDVTDLGISDVEPVQHVGQNWPLTSPLGAEPTTAALSTLPAQSLFGQPFGVIVKSTSPLTTITKEEVTSILTGSYGNWSQVPSAQGTALATSSAEIKVCVREDGSGSGSTSKIYFLNQGCGNSYVHAPGSIFGNTVSVNSTTANMEACVQAGDEWIGIPVNQRPTATTGTKFLNLNGVVPTELNAALGLYDYWYEATGTINPSLPAGDTRTLAENLVAAIRKAANVPNGSGGAISIANSGTNTPVLPIADANRPLAIATRGGNSCAPLQGVN